MLVTAGADLCPHGPRPGLMSLIANVGGGCFGGGPCLVIAIALSSAWYLLETGFGMSTFHSNLLRPSHSLHHLTFGSLAA